MKSPPLFIQIKGVDHSCYVTGNEANLSIVDHINRLDIANAPAKDVQAVIADGIYRRIGKQNITSASVESGIVSNIGFDESLMYEAWNNISLKKLPGLPIYKPSGGITALTEHLNNVRNIIFQPTIMFSPYK